MNCLFRIQVISDAHAASLNTGKAFQSYVQTNNIPIQVNEAITERAKPRTVADAILITEPIQKPLKDPRLFVLWWSTLTQSILQLLRQRTSTTTSNLNQTFIATTPFPVFQTDDPTHNVNDVAAGLDTIIVDAPPVFDSMPLEQ